MRATKDKTSVYSQQHQWVQQVQGYQAHHGLPVVPQIHGLPEHQSLPVMGSKQLLLVSIMENCKSISCLICMCVCIC